MQSHAHVMLPDQHRRGDARSYGEFRGPAREGSTIVRQRATGRRSTHITPTGVRNAGAVRWKGSARRSFTQHRRQKFAAIRRASSRVSSLAAERRPGSSPK